MSDGPGRRGEAHPGGAPPRCPVDTSLSVDEAWLREWANEGIGKLGLLLAAHAAFDAYVASRDNAADGDDAD